MVSGQSVSAWSPYRRQIWLTFRQRRSTSRRRRLLPTRRTENWLWPFMKQSLHCAHCFKRQIEPLSEPKEAVFFPPTSRRWNRPPRVRFFLAGHSSSLLPHALFLSRLFGFYGRPPREDINKRSLGSHKSHKKVFCSRGATEGFALSWSGGVLGFFFLLARVKERVKEWARCGSPS